MEKRKSSQKTQIPGFRIYEARLAKGISQENLGVLIGLDEGTASARISRYESGIHEPPIDTARNIAESLGVPLAYLYCEEAQLASLLLKLSKLGKRDLSELAAKLAE
ncbi:helix-turn-helix domain-containing protein [Polynucleobacter sp. AP-Reno-20A-A9]|uniref:helix-turn-helix domain-containing protein n=1 Tax=Polynucleobacter sp. AP-Reno-20A-A9 TaxID=2576925 RepID=UPI001C0D7688|nr:helix-turn-helix transcriptional regulator [Polynucleobacter sp. AP-Reno-20A-A9]MBU3628912.1 helix-turn-helix transcriptional regulator [Polynucleobacter sp. AP-Reno-20A-A9]